MGGGGICTEMRYGGIAFFSFWVYIFKLSSRSRLKLKYVGLKSNKKESLHTAFLCKYRSRTQAHILREGYSQELTTISSSDYPGLYYAILSCKEILRSKILKYPTIKYKSTFWASCDKTARAHLDLPNNAGLSLAYIWGVTDAPWRPSVTCLALGFFGASADVWRSHA